jgi:hypothetical protein
MLLLINTLLIFYMAVVLTVLALREHRDCPMNNSPDRWYRPV